MHVARVKVRRREVRRKRVADSSRLLDRYGLDRPVESSSCLLQQVLAKEAVGVQD